MPPKSRPNRGPAKAASWRPADEAPARPPSRKAAEARRAPRRGGRTQAPKKARRTSGRYTAPIPRRVKRSPSWYPWVLISLLVLGVLCIVLNYMSVLPGSPTNWYVLGGLVAILAGALMATSYR